jgi:hypothetical protein
VVFAGDWPYRQCGQGDEVEIRCRRTNLAHFFLSGVNCSTQMPIQPDAWIIQPELLTVLVLIPTVIMTILVISLLVFITALFRAF